jgi:hypothetical protein
MKRAPRPCEACGQMIEKPNRPTQRFHGACSKGQPPTPGKAKAHPLYQQAVALASKIGAAKAAQQLGLSYGTVRSWRESAGVPALRRGRPRRKPIAASDKEAGPLKAWCGWCGASLPEGFDYCDDDCRAEAKADERESA